MTAVFLPSSTSVILETLEEKGWQLQFEQRFEGPCSRKMTWGHDDGTLDIEIWPAFASSRLTGKLPEWFNEIEPHALELEDLQAVVRADIPVSERIEACVQSGIFYVDRALDEAYIQWLRDRLNDRAELQLAALEVLRLLAKPVLLSDVEALATHGTLYVQQLATVVLADLMIGF